MEQNIVSTCTHCEGQGKKLIRVPTQMDVSREATKMVDCKFCNGAGVIFNSSLKLSEKHNDSNKQTQAPEPNLESFDIFDPLYKRDESPEGLKLEAQKIEEFRIAKSKQTIKDAVQYFCTGIVGWEMGKLLSDVLFIVDASIPNKDQNRSVRHLIRASFDEHCLIISKKANPEGRDLPLHGGYYISPRTEKKEITSKKG